MNLTAQGVRRGGIAVLLAVGVGLPLTGILLDHYRLDSTAARDLFLIFTGPLSVFVHAGMRIFVPLWMLIRKESQ